MGRSNVSHDEEAVLGAQQHHAHDRYHDSPNDSDDEATIGPDAPLRDSSGTPSIEFDGLRVGGSSKGSWQDNIARRIPPQLHYAWEKTVEWVKGPNPPRIFKIEPLFPQIQHAPIELLDRYAPKRIQRFGLLALVIACWLFAFSMILRASSFTASIPRYGSPVRLSCSAKYWSDGNICGINGDECRPFSNATMAFRCPAECSQQQVFNPHAVGDQEVVYKSLVIGGPTDQQTGYEDELTNNAIYRADSFICASAVHAGFLNDAEGGCGVLALTGEQSDFRASKRNGIKSFPFDSYFPRSFGFLAGTRAQCKDLRWPALGISVFFSALISLFTTSPSVFFWTNWTILFFQTALATDPPSLTNYYSLLSVAFGRFLPACFCGWVTYKYTSRRSLEGLTAQVEKLLLWMGPAWVGALNNQTFDKIPIQRLTPHDIQAQPGAIPALITVVLTIFFIALGQAWSFRVEGRMPRYLGIYSLFVLGLLICVALPGLSLRIHHYILALLLLPGTSFQNRPSLVYQGLLVGLFINGIARWGYASILEPPSDLLRGSQMGTLLPRVEVLSAGVGNITFNLGPLPRWDGKVRKLFDGVSVLVNDVERFRGYGDDAGYWDQSGITAGRAAAAADDDEPVDVREDEKGDFIWTWHRHHARRAWQGGRGDGDMLPSPAAPDDPGDRRRGRRRGSLDGDSEEMIEENETDQSKEVVLPEYFRFGYMAGSSVGDFSKAGKWLPDGEWIEMESGPS
ncbi:hypothetical protein D0863_06350 [Hortaea werneckii]|uniref:LCCL domain-containing protein n=1 Tax=Hortaea werneckii TaxID=91943 RepID=A0A3M7E083_HORWE|nr:hypothetical protein D0863_06350 [Hortaea werneckii]